MIKKLGICFLIFASCLSFSPLFARDGGHRDSGRHDMGRQDMGRHDSGHNWDHNNWNGNWGHNWNGNWGHNWNGNWGNNWGYDQDYYPGNYSDYTYTDYYPATTTMVYTNPSVGSYAITSSGFQNGVYIVFVANGMAFQMSYPGYNPVGSYVDIYSQGGLTFSLVMNGQTYSATRVK